MNFQELQIGDYFRIPGMNRELVYRKATSSNCSRDGALQPIRPQTTVIKLNAIQVKEYFFTKFTRKQQFLQSLRQNN